MQSPITVSVSGPTLESCHENILKMAAEIQNLKNAKISHGESTLPKSLPSAMGEPSPVLNFPKPVGEMGHVADVLLNHNPTLKDIPVTGSNVDAEGIPWDARIHASSREKTEKGVWRKRRGLEDGMYEKVKAELTGVASQQTSFPSTDGTTSQPALGSSNAPPVAIPSIPTTAVHVPFPTEASVLNQIPMQPLVLTPPAVELPPNTHNLESFRNNLVNILNKLSNEGKINETYIGQLKTWFGKEVYEFAQDEAKCAQLFTVFIDKGFVNKL